MHVLCLQRESPNEQLKYTRHYNRILANELLDVMLPRLHKKMPQMDLKVTVNRVILVH